MLMRLVELHRHTLLNKYIPYLASDVAWLIGNFKHGGKYMIQVAKVHNQVSKLP